MEGFGLLLGHLVGDYLVQNDWMAANKIRKHPGMFPDKEAQTACTVHCALYTLAVWLFSFWWMPWWGLLICFFVHWPIDRFRLARWWMENIAGQKAFATGPLSPWSVVIVDNTFHLLTLWIIWLLTEVS